MDDSVLISHDTTVAQNGELTFDKITKTTKFFKLFSKHAQRKGVEATSLQFFLRGNPIRNNDTATTLKFTKKVTLIHCVMAKQQMEYDPCSCPLNTL